ncbi:hypothetical protein P154DRAFT_582594 [Amniculicola lignicola CBS 123094]|uniref:Uncharacterized protein n=1 Tax=Amniculicola lignicola CBS 123094 TaxID=1392246 RepID=A0A6A5W0G4_9PLEO|nr:hypothetical protein P154DRAFT_582594 [Amniculicola lignicola CBS 123094]
MSSDNEKRMVHAPQETPQQKQKRKMPLQLFNQLSLTSGSATTVTVPSPITLFNLNGIAISSSAPITFTVASGSQLSIRLAAPPGSKFQHSWDTLPDELREQIIKATVVMEGPLTHHSWKRVWRPFLQITPEIAAMAKGMFYKHNLF